LESQEARLQIPRCVDVKLDVRLADFPLDTDVVPKLIKVCSFGPICVSILLRVNKLIAYCQIIRALKNITFTQQKST